jgi:hypothetical protein
MIFHPSRFTVYVKKYISEQRREQGVRWCTKRRRRGSLKINGNTRIGVGKRKKKEHDLMNRKRK